MMLGLIEQFGNSPLMLGIAWPLSRMKIWGAEPMYLDVHLQCKLQVQVHSSVPFFLGRQR